MISVSHISEKQKLDKRNIKLNWTTALEAIDSSVLVKHAIFTKMPISHKNV
jgi:hypothetical protein